MIGSIDPPKRIFLEPMDNSRVPNLTRPYVNDVIRLIIGSFGH